LERLQGVLTLPPILVLHHALLNKIMFVFTPGLTNKLVHQVFLFLKFLFFEPPVVSREV